MVTLLPRTGTKEPIDLRIGQRIVVEIVVVNVVFVIVEAGHSLQPRCQKCAFRAPVRLPRSKLALPDETLAKV